MDRRRFLAAGALGAGAGAASSLAAPAIAQDVTRLRCVTTWPANFPGLGYAPQRIAEYAETMSGGSLQIEVYAAGELAPAFEAFDVVSSGGADMYHGAEYYWQGKSPAFNFFAAVPFGLTATDFTAWINFGGGQELWDALAAEFGIKPFLAGNTGHQTGGWFRNEIETLEDFRGLTMRIPGLGGEVIRQLGGSAIALSGGEIFQSLQSGAIDATEWVGPWNDLAFGFHRITPYYYSPGFHEPGTALSLGINLERWEGLSAEHQAIIRHACASANDLSIGEFAWRNGEALNALVLEHGVQLRGFSDEIWSEIARVSEEVVAEVGASDDATAAIYASYRAARARLSEWTAFSEAPYLRRRQGALSGR